MTTGSANIPVFDIKSVLDLTSKPKLSLLNLSTGTQAACKFIFTLLSPLQIPIHQGSFNTPDKTGLWTSFVFPEELPVYNFAFEWGNYTLKCSVKDGSDVYTLPDIIINASIPNGNDPAKDRNNYGKAGIYYEVRCHTGKVYVEDQTDSYYRGQVGSLISRRMVFTYPAREGTAGSSIISLGVPNSRFDIPYNAEGFDIFLEAIYDYTIAPNVVVRIKYINNECLNIACNIDLCKLICEVQKFKETVSCSPTSENVLSLLQINTNLNLILLARTYPDCGVDIVKLVNEITEIGNFDCNCISTSGTGIGGSVDDIKSLGVQIFNLAKTDVELRNYFCSISCSQTTPAPTTKAPCDAQVANLFINTNNNTANWTGSGSIISFLWKIDNGPWTAAISSPVYLGSLPPGNYTFFVKAVCDFGEGNMLQSPFVIAATTQPPTTPAPTTPAPTTPAPTTPAPTTPAPTTPAPTTPAPTTPAPTTQAPPCNAPTEVEVVMVDSNDLIASFGYSSVDPFVNNSTAPVYTEVGTYVMQPGGNILANLHAIPQGSYPVIKYPSSEPDMTAWSDQVNQPFNYGTIPEPGVWRSIITVSGNKYIIGMLTDFLDTSSNSVVTLSHP